jgi:hypothetical protein
MDSDLSYLIRLLEILHEATGFDRSADLVDVTRDGLKYTDVPAVKEAFGVLMHARVVYGEGAPGIARNSDEAWDLVLRSAREFATVLRETGSRRAGFGK